MLIAGHGFAARHSFLAPATSDVLLPEAASGCCLLLPSHVIPCLLRNLACVRKTTSHAQLSELNLTHILCCPAVCCVGENPVRLGRHGRTLSISIGQLTGQTRSWREAGRGQSAVLAMDGYINLPNTRPCSGRPCQSTLSIRQVHRWVEVFAPAKPCRYSTTGGAAVDIQNMQFGQISQLPTVSFLSLIICFFCVCMVSRMILQLMRPSTQHPVPANSCSVPLAQ